MKTTLLIAASAIVAGCASVYSGPIAEATLAPTRGNSASGMVTFAARGDKVQVSARVSGLTPGGHGFHIHEKGDCSAPDATSAGGHFNPGGQPHGHPDQGPHHAGDMPMLVADGYGNATLSAELASVSLGEGANGIIGKAVVVHAAPDDFKTQPTGNSGARVACGVITRR
ncbi:MAG: superoxide dismutase family protein [Pseudomonadota bacterium]